MTQLFCTNISIKNPNRLILTYVVSEITAASWRLTVWLDSTVFSTNWEWEPISVLSLLTIFSLPTLSDCKAVESSRQFDRDIFSSLISFCKMIFQPKGHTDGQFSRGFKSSRTSSLRIPSSWSQRMMVSEVAVSPNFSFRQFSKLGFNAVAGVIALWPLPN